MVYIEELDSYLIKYAVKINKEELEKLKTEIISKCDIIIHQSYDGFDGPEKNNLHIINLERKEIEPSQEIDELYKSDQIMYHYEYDELIDTRLVKIINELLNNNTNVISMLKNPVKEEYDFGKKALQAKIEEIYAKITDENLKKAENINEHSENLINYVNQLDLIDKSIMKNIKRESDINYYYKVLELIELTEIDRIKISTIEEVNSFFLDVKQANLSREIDSKKLEKVIK